MAYEEANYEVVSSNEVYEIRKYSNRLAVETITINQNNSFRKLFKYISGSNKTNKKIKMTTPVTQIEREGKMTMQFYLPSFSGSITFAPLYGNLLIVIISW